MWAYCTPKLGVPDLWLAEESGGDWTTATCPAGYKVIGGGCDAEGSPYHYRKSGPEGDNGWHCGGFGSDKHVMAFCLPSGGFGDKISVVQASGGDWTTATCPEGQKVIGGGCDATAEPYKFSKSGPDGDSTWVCGGFGGAKTVWAFCCASCRVTLAACSSSRVGACDPRGPPSSPHPPSSPELR